MRLASDNLSDIPSKPRVVEDNLSIFTDEWLFIFKITSEQFDCWTLVLDGLHVLVAFKEMWIISHAWCVSWDRLPVCFGTTLICSWWRWLYYWNHVWVIKALFSLNHCLVRVFLFLWLFALLVARLLFTCLHFWGLSGLNIHLGLALVLIMLRETRFNFDIYRFNILRDALGVTLS